MNRTRAHQHTYTRARARAHRPLVYRPYRATIFASQMHRTHSRSRGRYETDDASSRRHFASARARPNSAPGTAERRAARARARTFKLRFFPPTTDTPPPARRVHVHSFTRKLRYTCFFDKFRNGPKRFRDKMDTKTLAVF